MIAPESAIAVSWQCIHFGTLLEGREELERCKQRRFCAIQIDLAGVQVKSELLVRIASAMNFPDGFGMNWDALNDLLGDLSWLNPKGLFVVLENSRALWRQPTVAGSLIELWLSSAEFWAKRDVPFHLAFTWD